jgi:hypothetical protein
MTYRGSWYSCTQFDKWIRLDARGNKENINAYFSLNEERLAYTI